MEELVMKKKIYIISLIIIVGLLIGGTTYYYLQISPTNYNQTKHQAKKIITNCNDNADKCFNKRS